MTDIFFSEMLFTTSIWISQSKSKNNQFRLILIIKLWLLL